MKTILSLVFLFLVFTVNSQSTAEYNITFTSEWSPTTHPSTEFPDETAHWSRLVGAVHNSNYTLYTVGELASLGVKDVAERGNNDEIFIEIDQEILNGNALSRIRGPFLLSDIGQINITNVLVHEDFPLISLVSMIAPSPDWFIGVRNVSMLDSNNQWIEEIEIDVYPMDAGTDSAPFYSHTNTVTTPAENIQSYQGNIPFSNARMGTIRFVLLNEFLNTNESTKDLSIVVYPNPATETVQIQSKQKEIIEYQLFSENGKSISKNSINNNELKIDISDLNSGVYFILLKLSDGSLVSEKLIVS